MRVGWYVHHLGSGHRRRAGCVAAVLRQRGAHVTLLGSGGGVDVRLPRDDGEPPHDDPTAGGRLHWAPLRHAGLRGRMAALAAWVDQERPDVVVVDVSVEVTALVRLLGVPVVVVAQPGRREDAAHELGYDLASAVLAPWPAEVDPAPSLARWAAKVAHVGGISALAGGPAGTHGDSTGVLLVGGEGWDDPGLPSAVRAAVPGLGWEEVGGGRWVDDVGSLLRGAAVVVSHAGQNAVADLAATLAPAVVVPQERSFEEQVHLARELRRAGLCVTVEAAGPVDWARAVDEARAAPTQWERWRTSGAAERAADVVLGCAGG